MVCLSVYESVWPCPPFKCVIIIWCSACVRLIFYPWTTVCLCSNKSSCVCESMCEWVTVINHFPQVSSVLCCSTLITERENIWKEGTSKGKPEWEWSGRKKRKGERERYVWTQSSQKSSLTHMRTQLDITAGYPNLGSNYVLHKRLELRALYGLGL